jgi:transcriptional regulator with XRE-family HTH domain
LPALELGEETTGQRASRLRRERGYTQNELAERIGTIQALVSDYERDKLRLNAEMAVRFAIPLEVSTDELLGLHHGNRKSRSKSEPKKPSRRVLRRLEKIESLPTHNKPSCSSPSTLSSKLPANSGARKTPQSPKVIPPTSALWLSVTGRRPSYQMIADRIRDGPSPCNHSSSQTRRFVDKRDDLVDNVDKSRNPIEVTCLEKFRCAATRHPTRSIGFISCPEFSLSC